MPKRAKLKDNRPWYILEEVKRVSVEKGVFTAEEFDEAIRIGMNIVWDHKVVRDKEYIRAAKTAVIARRLNLWDYHKKEISDIVPLEHRANPLAFVRYVTKFHLTKGDDGNGEIDSKETGD